jgi:hypothetical protein
LFDYEAFYKLPRVRYDGVSSKEEDLTLPAKDLYHDAVKSALLKDGWQITADPYRITYKDIDLYADLAAERPIAATRKGEKIVVEIKSFVGRSPMNDLHGAVGQYVIYRDLLRETEPEYRLYLAIDDITYENFFRREGIDFLRRASQIPLIIVDIEKEEIVQWIS